MCAGKLSNCVLEGGGLDYDRMWSDNGAETIPRCEELTINFLTPTEILSGKEPIREVDFNTLIDSLFGRIGGIIDNYTEGEFVIPYSLFARRPFVKAEYNLRPINFQTSGQPIYGFLGAVRYLGDVTRYLPYIDLGSQIHMGKKTTRACGEYSFEI
ncbi:MAG: CRISPR system precrRNA processing endoribonuclease RAMP protein Cas6 [Peptococcaceae bacterium]|nr:CRISPR system precrRNA processing endoribonuclease RAMP protein Cas6 [Peptococcaceae bacterium]